MCYRNLQAPPFLLCLSFGAMKLWAEKNGEKGIFKVGFHTSAHLSDSWIKQAWLSVCWFVSLTVFQSTFINSDNGELTLEHFTTFWLTSVLALNPTLTKSQSIWLAEQLWGRWSVGGSSVQGRKLLVSDMKIWQSVHVWQLISTCAANAYCFDKNKIYV